MAYSIVYQVMRKTEGKRTKKFKKFQPEEIPCAFLPEISHWLTVGKSSHARKGKLHQ
jgi:hypothetical protein